MWNSLLQADIQNPFDSPRRIAALIAARRVKRPGFIRLQSNLVVGDTTLNGDIDGWMSLAAHVMSATIPDVLQPGALRWFGKTQVTGRHSEDAVCVWTVSNEAVGSMRACHMM
ncbi:hypothetical protein TNCV_1807061 [Trichonephila clavipes]|nr:hypothetical protein TNCV_1807061 [Trichonephila clavipes]